MMRKRSLYIYVIFVFSFQIVMMNENRTEEFQNMAIPVTIFFGFHTPCIDFIIIIIIITASTFFLGVYKRGEIVCKFIYQILIRRGIVMSGRTYVVYEFRTLPLLEKRISASYRSTCFLGI